MTVTKLRVTHDMAVTRSLRKSHSRIPTCICSGVCSQSSASRLAGTASLDNRFLTVYQPLDLEYVYDAFI